MTVRISHAADVQSDHYRVFIGVDTTAPYRAVVENAQGGELAKHSRHMPRPDLSPAPDLSSGQGTARTMKGPQDADLGLRAQNAIEGPYQVHWCASHRPADTDRCHHSAFASFLHQLMRKRLTPARARAFPRYASARRPP